MSRSILSSRFSWLVIALILGAAVFVHPARAQTPTPSAEEIEIFRNLPEEQQQAILESLGRQGGTVRGDVTDRSRTSTTTRRTGRTQPSDLISQMSEREREPRFKAEDTLLLSIEVREFKGQDEPPTLLNVPTIPGVPTTTPGAPAATTAPGTTPMLQQQPREPIVRTKEERDRLDELRTRILRRNPLQLDKWGILNLPELGPIPLAGLSAEEARKRLAAEPLLADYIVKVTYLPLKPIGAQALKPFGQSLFSAGPETFTPPTDIPVPAEYVVGPGDTFEVQLVGSTKGRFTLVVRRDGRINFPEIGPIAVGGMRFDQARAMLEQRVTEQLIGTQASVQMGELRSIQVFVVGEARQPGAYTVSGLSTVTNALFLSGGVKDSGSLRNIEVKRSGTTVTHFDLYDLLLKGDTRADVRLMSGDVILIPPVGQMVGATGEVRRRALFELKGEKTVADLMRLAGGLAPEADARLATIDRVDATRKRTVVDVDLTAAAGGSVALQDGDILDVPTIRPTVEDAVIVEGHVHRPGSFQYRTGMRISDVISSLEELKPMADQHYLLIRREVPPTRRVTFRSADLVKALEQKHSDADIELAPRDQIYVFNLETGRDRMMDPLLRELRLQSTRDAPTAEVGVGGRVNAPGQYPLETGMRVSDLIRAGGSLNEAAYGGKAELTRNATDGGEARQTELIDIDLAKAMAGDPKEDLVLQPFDHLTVKELPLWGAQEYVEVQGEVRFPGKYPIQRGETLKSVVERAGGVTPLAFVQGSVFTRQTLKDREKKQIEELTRRMQTDLAQLSLMAARETGGNATQALAVGQQLLANLREAEPVGRLVISFEKSVAAAIGSAQDIVLKDGDKLFVPRITQEVTVIGEVQSPTSHLYTDGLSRADYIDMSGGVTQRADKGRIYVVRADGSVVGSGNSWFSGGGVAIRPGDTVVVPLDAERMRALPLWTAVTTIIYNLAIAVAAVNSF